MSKKKFKFELHELVELANGVRLFVIRRHHNPQCIPHYVLSETAGQDGVWVVQLPEHRLTRIRTTLINKAAS